MIYWLATWLAPYWHALHVFEYVTLRAVLAALTGLIILWATAPWYIRKIKALQVGQVVRDDGPERHLQKTGTPTMGGVLIILVTALSMLLWCRLDNMFVWAGLWVLIASGVVGFIDDYRKVVRNNTKGLSARGKLVSQALIALIAMVALYITNHTPAATTLMIPFFKDVLPQLGWWYIVLGFLVIIGSSNAVNLTDGLDGLALLPVVMVSGALSVFAYVLGNAFFANYLNYPYIAGMGEVGVMGSALVGSGLGFLWYNTYPADIFMGDVGSLSLGAFMGAIAVMTCQEILLVIMGGIFVIETISVILQVGSYKLRQGKRIFKMAPLHHHFELKGWPEPRVIVRFWIITLVLVLIGLATMKLR
jgi:phospho-N-acetylmuramoyl-pentapeptide-transferase